MSEKKPASSTNLDTAKQQKGPTTAERVAELEARLENLQNLVIRVCTYTGQNHLLKEFGLKPWEVTKESTRRAIG